MRVFLCVFFFSYAQFLRYLSSTGTELRKACQHCTNKPSVSDASNLANCPIHEPSSTRERSTRAAARTSPLIERASERYGVRQRAGQHHQQIIADTALMALSRVINFRSRADGVEKTENSLPIFFHPFFGICVIHGFSSPPRYPRVSFGKKCAGEGEGSVHGGEANCGVNLSLLIHSTHRTRVVINEPSSLP